MEKTQKPATESPEALERHFFQRWIDDVYSLRTDLSGSDLIWLENAAEWLERNGPREYADKARGIMENNDLF